MIRSFSSSHALAKESSLKLFIIRRQNYAFFASLASISAFILLLRRNLKKHKKTSNLSKSKF